MLLPSPIFGSKLGRKMANVCNLDSLSSLEDDCRGSSPIKFRFLNCLIKIKLFKVG